MRVRCTVGLLVALAGSPAAAQQGRLDAVAVARAADSLAARPIWPGFEPRRHPVLIYDGRRTLLVRHPGHPAGFGPAGEGGARWYEGRHPLVAGNSFRSLDGIMLATLLPPSQPRTNAELGSTLIHELFHVHQQQRHTGWTANEAAIFELPMGEPAPLAARRLESATLAHALAAATDAERACRARAALAVRRARFAAQPAEASRYERHLELSEGLARHVERVALGVTAAPALPRDEFAADGLRLRSYWSGSTLAWLLDRHAPGWPERVDAAEGRYLDELLAAALGEGPACELDAATRAELHASATRDATALRDEWRARERAFDAAPGEVLEVEAGGAPFMVGNFDPGNVTMLDATRVLHARAVTLVAGADTVDVLDRVAITEAAGPHPLFAGVRRIRVRGLPAIEVRQDGARVRACGGGACASLAGGTVTREGNVVRLVRAPATPVPASGSSTTR